MDPEAVANQTVVRTELITPGPAEALANLLGTGSPTDRLPPLWHWIYLLDKPLHTDLGKDGHPRVGVPAPPGPGLKRMFAGGRVMTHAPLEVGLPATRTTWVAGTTPKQGSTGPLTFVTIRGEYSQEGQVRVVDESDIVYRTPESNLSIAVGTLREAPGPPAREPCLTLTADEALLFRFSALTYNAHRIHYDYRWAQEEGYSDLVVHGPLQALMMGELARREGDGLVGKRFTYRLISPMIGPQNFIVCAGEGAVNASYQVADVHGAVKAISILSSLEPSGITSSSS